VNWTGRTIVTSSWGPSDGIDTCHDWHTPRPSSPNTVAGSSRTAGDGPRPYATTCNCPQINRNRSTSYDRPATTTEPNDTDMTTTLQTDTMTPIKVYLAGPMRGIPEFNKPAFTEATTQLRAAGYEVFSPVEHDEMKGFDWAGHTGDLSAAEASGFSLRAALGADLAWICAHADAIAVLPGWEHSLGARAEVAVARALGLPVIRYVDDHGPVDR